MGQAVERWSEVWLDRKSEHPHGMELPPFQPYGSKPTSPPPSPPEDAPTTAPSSARSMALNSAPQFAQPPSLHSLAPALNSAPAPLNQPAVQQLARGGAMAPALSSVIGVGGGCGTCGGYAAEVHWERPQCVDPAAARQPKPNRPSRATAAEAGAAAPGTARDMPGTAPSATRSTAGARIIPPCHPPDRGFVNSSSPPRCVERCVERNFAATGAGVVGGFGLAAGSSLSAVLAGSVAAVGGFGGGGVGGVGGPMRGREARLGVPHEVEAPPPSPRPAPQCCEPRQPTSPNTSPPEPPASSTAPTTTPMDEFVSPPRSPGTHSHRASPGGRSHRGSPSDRSPGVVPGGGPGGPGVVPGAPRAACSLSAQFSVVAPPPNSTLPHASAPPYFASVSAPETEAALARFRETSERLPSDFRETSERLPTPSASDSAVAARRDAACAQAQLMGARADASADELQMQSRASQMQSRAGQMRSRAVQGQFQPLAEQRAKAEARVARAVQMEERERQRRLEGTVLGAKQLRCDSQGAPNWAPAQLPTHGPSPLPQLLPSTAPPPSASRRPEQQLPSHAEEVEEGHHALDETPEDTLMHGGVHGGVHGGGALLLYETTAEVLSRAQAEAQLAQAQAQAQIELARAAESEWHFQQSLLELEQETQLVQLLEIGELLGTVHASLVPDCLPLRMTLLIAILI